MSETTRSKDFKLTRTAHQTAQSRPIWPLPSPSRQFSIAWPLVPSFVFRVRRFRSTQQSLLSAEGESRRISTRPGAVCHVVGDEHEALSILVFLRLPERMTLSPMYYVLRYGSCLAELRMLCPRIRLLRMKSFWKKVSLQRLSSLWMRLFLKLTVYTLSCAWMIEPDTCVGGDTGIDFPSSFDFSCAFE